MRLPNPLLTGFHPDPSIVRVDGNYFLVTSSFEYLPGIPIHHSTDLVDWNLVGHVITRPEQFDAAAEPTNGGIWAPTIRHHDGLFYVIVSAMLGGMRIYTAVDPAGPWSDGTPLPSVEGIDPDLAWDEDGMCYVTFAGLPFNGPDAWTHRGIQQVRVDPATGEVDDVPRSLWSGSGRAFPEAPHLYRIGRWWYLMIAEGGTGRGHMVNIARSNSPTGPFEPNGANPILTASGTTSVVQNTGHGDLVVAPDGTWSMVLLGVRTGGMNQAFSPLGRETFGVHVEWQDAWPVVDPVELTPDRDGPEFVDLFDEPTLEDGWIGVRRDPRSFAKIEDGSLHLVGEGRTMDDGQPTFVGRRLRRHRSLVCTLVRGDGVGGLSMRYDEEHHLDLEVRPGFVTARIRIPSLTHEVEVGIPARGIDLAFEVRPAPRTIDEITEVPSMAALHSCDRIRFVAIDAAGTRHELAEFDGRSLTSESACSFTGRVAGAYCVSGMLRFDGFEERDLPR